MADHPASDISVTPVGEITATDVQAALEDLDHRTRIDRFLEDREVGFDIKEEFLGGGSYPAGGWIGQSGWSIPAAITAFAPPNIQIAQGAFGVVAIGTLREAEWNNINLGVASFTGTPVLHLKFRARVPVLNSGSHQSAFFLGLHSDLAGAEPDNGLYFRCTGADGPDWVAVVANGGSRTALGTAVAPVAATFQWFEILSDGAGVIRFYIDGALVQSITTDLPAGPNRYGPAFTVVRTLGSNKFRNIQVDTYDLRVEGAR